MFFICPLCKTPLIKESNSYYCENKHSYDIASEGYVHLILSNQMNSKNPGDSKEMVLARESFLSRGYYFSLKDALCKEIKSLSNNFNMPNILDCGCGEGYYTNEIYKYLIEQDKIVNMAGIDISKIAIRKAAKKAKNTELNFAVASVYHLPVEDNKIDVLINIFSPLCIEEYQRVVKNGGYMIYVVPAKNHLWELKEVLYDKPYQNEEAEIEYDGFKYIDVIEMRDKIKLNNSQDIKNLFSMTPYLWRTPKEGIEKLDNLNELNTKIEFNIHIFRRV